LDPQFVHKSQPYSHEKQAFQCTSLMTQYELLSNTDIDEIKMQIIDKVDTESLEALNNKRFLEFPINLQGLIY